MQLIIVLSTYNGDHYLTAQLDSIFQQKVPCDLLLIRDDGSTDATLDILKKYQQTYPQISIIEDEDGNVGVAKSYGKLLRHATTFDAEFIMYADQDDIWFPEKTEKLLQAITPLDNKKPALVFSDAEVVDSELHTIADSFLDFQKFHAHHNISFNALLLFSPALGCCMIFNQALLLKMVTYSSDLFSYPDKLALIIATCFGQVVQLKEQTMLYRQHNTNVSCALKGIHRSISLNSFYFLKTRYQTAVNEAKQLGLIITDLPKKEKKALHNFILLFTGHYATRVKNYFKFWLLPPHRHRKAGLLLSLLFKFE